MRSAVDKGLLGQRRILLARPGLSWDVDWLQDVDAAFGPAGMVACRASGGEETAQRVREGRLAAAVFWAERQWGDGLTLIRIVRSISCELPCWIVGDDASPWALQEALALQVTSVLAQHVGANELTHMLQRRLSRAGGSCKSFLGN